MSHDYDDDLRRQDWAALSRRLTKYAYTATKGASWELAEDLAQTVITRLFDPSRRVWDRTKYPDLFDFLAADLRNHVLPNHRKKRSTLAEMAYEHATLERLDEGEDEKTDTRERAASPEMLVSHEEQQAKRRDRLLRDFADDPIALGVIALVDEEVDGREAQATALGTSVAVITNARKRIAKRLAEIDASDEEGDRDG